MTSKKAFLKQESLYLHHTASSDELNYVYYCLMSSKNTTCSRILTTMDPHFQTVRFV